MVSALPNGGVGKGPSPAPGFDAGGRLRYPCTLLRPTIGGQHLPFAREGGEHAAQFGVARFAGGSSTFPTRKSVSYTHLLTHATVLHPVCRRLP